MSEHLERLATPTDNAQTLTVHVEGNVMARDELISHLRHALPGVSVDAAQAPAVRLAAEHNERQIREALDADAAKLRGDQERIRRDTANALGPFELKSAKVQGEFMTEPKQPREPAVRIVHRGGPARLARVYLDGHEADNATRVEIVLDASQRPGTHARIEFVGRAPIESANVQLDVSSDEAELSAIPLRPHPVFWPVLLGLLLDAIPAGLAWWTWQTPGALATAVWVLSVIGGIIWTLGVLCAFVGYARVMVIAEHDESDDCECEQ